MRRVGPLLVVMALSCAALVWNLGRANASTPTSGRRLWATVRVCSDPNNLPFSDAAGEGF